MGRIKDLVIELQNEYGFDLEKMPSGFAMDEYLEMKSKEENFMYKCVASLTTPTMREDWLTLEKTDDSLE